MSYKINYGLIGCGRVSPKHAWAFKKTGANLIYACDLEIAKAKKLAKEYGFRNSTVNYLDILKDPEINAVSICTDHRSHMKIAIDALLYGKNVLLEKPMAADLVDARKIAATASKSEYVFSVVSQDQYDPVIKLINEMFRSGAFGELIAANVICQEYKPTSYYAESYWRGKSRLEGGSVLINQAIHPINVLTWMIGTPVEVAAEKRTFKFSGVIDTEDSIFCMLKYKSGGVCNIIATNASTYDAKPRIEIACKKGSISFDLGFPDELLYLNLADKKLETQFRSKLQRASKSRIKPPSNLTYYGVGHYYQVLDFISCIRNKRKPIIDYSMGLESNMLVDWIYSAVK